MLEIMTPSHEHSALRKQHQRTSSSISAGMPVPGLEDLSLQPRQARALRDLDNMALPDTPKSAPLPIGKDASLRAGVHRHAQYDKAQENGQAAKSLASSSRASRKRTPAVAATRPVPTRRRSGTRLGSVKGKSAVQARRIARSTSPSCAPPKSFAGAKQLPIKLPSPPLTIISDPYDDLASHMRRHGFVTDADEFAQAKGITADFVLHAWMTGIAHEGPAGLLNATSSFMDEHGAVVHAQLDEAQVHDLPIPSSFSVPSARHPSDTEAFAAGTAPTHIFAIHGNGGTGKGFLVPAHGLVYALQCGSLPCLGGTSRGESGADEAMHKIPVVGITVPRPDDFAIVHRYLYLRDGSSLMLDLLPMHLIAQYAEDHRRKIAQHEAYLMPPPMHASQAASSFRAAARLNDISTIFAGAPALSPSEYSSLMDWPGDVSDASSSAACPTTSVPNGMPRPRSSSLPSAASVMHHETTPKPKSMATCAVEALATLPANTLLTYVSRIHASWANGVAIGILASAYWSTLERAWTLVMAALSLKKDRLIDAESGGLKLGLSSASQAESTAPAV